MTAEPPPDGAETLEHPLSLAEVAGIFGRTPRSIRNWVSAGLLTPLALPRGPYFARADILALCSAKRRT